MTLQLHKDDGKGSVEPRPVVDPQWRRELQSPRWGAARREGQLPELPNSEMNPTSTPMSVLFWVVLGVITFIILVAGYATGFWVPPAPPA
jgi:hypothetical protein